MRLDEQADTKGAQEPYLRGYWCGASAGVILEAGGGEVVTDGVMQSFGEDPFRASDRILRVGRLELLLPSGKIPPHLGHASILEAVASGLGGDAGDDAAFASAVGDIGFLRGFAAALRTFECVPTIEEQRSTEGSDRTLAVLLCAVRKWGGA
jgi:hypothetical protein